MQTERSHATLTIVLVAACVAGAATSAFARSGRHGGGHVGVRAPVIFSGAGPTRPFVSRIPAPLPPPAQAPVINGPISQPAFRGLSGIGQ
jgi:hypothetical protein